MTTELFSVSEFCAVHNISRAFFYRLLADNRGPEVRKVGDRTMITREAAAAWRAGLPRRTSAPAAQAQR